MVFGTGRVLTFASFEYAEYPAPFCARTRNVYIVFGWLLITPVPVKDTAAPMSVNVEVVAVCDSTRIAVASGALFVQVKFTCVAEVAVALKFEGAAGSPCIVVDVTSFE